MENNRFDIREQKISDTEREFEKALRPLAFDDFNGQEKIIENLRVFVMAAPRAARSCIVAWPSRIGEDHTRQYRG